MAYIIEMISKKRNFDIKDIRQIVNNLPSELKGVYTKINEQEWGWPCYCDISKPIGNKITISGSYEISGATAEDFCRYFQFELDKYGYDVDVTYSEGVLFEEQISKDITNIELYKKEEHPDIEEVELKFEYKKLCDAIVDFSDELMTEFKKLADAMLEYAKKIEEKRMEEQNNESND